jgi:hypothetical protein
MEFGALAFSKGMQQAILKIILKKIHAGKDMAANGPRHSASRRRFKKKNLKTVNAKACPLLVELIGRG